MISLFGRHAAFTMILTGLVLALALQSTDAAPGLSTNDATLAQQILQDRRLDRVETMALQLLKGFNAGTSYGEIWIRDFNTFIKGSLSVHPPDEVKERVRRILQICKGFKVRLPEAALRFPLGHPAVVSVIAGAQRASEARRNAAMMNAKIPTGLWRALKAEKLMREGGEENLRRASEILYVQIPQLEKSLKASVAAETSDLEPTGVSRSTRPQASPARRHRFATGDRVSAMPT